MARKRRRRSSSASARDLAELRSGTASASDKAEAARKGIKPRFKKKRIKKRR